MTDIPKKTSLLLVWVILLAVIVILSNFLHSKHGRNCIAVREEELAAKSIGIDVIRYKMLAFLISCALCGLAGGLLAGYMGYLYPTMRDNKAYTPCISLTNYSRSVLLSNGQIRGETLRNGAWPGGKHPSPKAQFPTVGQDSPGFFTHRSQTPQRSFQGASAGTHATPAPNRAHSGLHGETRGVLDGGAITTLGAFCAVRKPCAAGCQNGKLCRFRVLVGCAPEERREPVGQRHAHARRCSEASRPRWAA